jgi:Raf kinase inhibitor-like YbhB/YbcL family protein
MKIESNIFSDNEMIPAKYTCDGSSLKIPLKISGVSKEAKSLAIIVDDPDAPNGDFVHYIVWDIDPSATVINAGEMETDATEGCTSLGKPGWVAPCPPSGVHHYYFKLYALNTILSMPRISTKKDLVKAMEGHIIENATLVGLYGKEKMNF